MAKHENSDNQPRKTSHGGRILLILVLLLAGGLGYLYYSVVKAPVSLDDPQAMVAAAPMDPEERFRVFAADGTVQVKLDAADLWSVLLEHTDADYLDTVNGQISGYGVEISGCGIHMDEAGLQLDLELFWKETRLLAGIPCDLEITGRKIALTPTGVKLGPIPLPVGSLLEGMRLEYDLTLPVLAEVTQMAFAEGAVLLTGPMGQDISQLVPLAQNQYQGAVFIESLRDLADALCTEEGFAGLMSHLEDSGSHMEALYHALFLQADPVNAEEYLKIRQGLTERFFPGIDFSGLDGERSAQSQQLRPLTLSLEKFFTAVVSDYNDKKFKLSGGEFLKKNKPFQADKFDPKTYDELFQVLDPDSIFLVLVQAEDGFIRNTSSFYRMCKDDQEFTREVDFNRTYILGCVLRGLNGDPYIMYESETHKNNTYSRVIKLVPLTEEETAALQEPGKFGVWIG